MQRLWWLNLLRGIVALVVGILILGWPAVGGRFFVNFLAVFWLSSGVLIGFGLSGCSFNLIISSFGKLLP